MTVRVIDLGPGGQAMGLEELLDLLEGGDDMPPYDPNAPKDHLLRFDDEETPRYARRAVKGEGGAPMKLTLNIEEAEAITEADAKWAAEETIKRGPCTCTNPKCAGRFVKAVAMKQPDGWVSKPYVHIPVADDATKH